MIHRLNIPVTDYQEIDAGHVISAAACRSGRSDVIDIWFETHVVGMPKGVYILGTGHPTPWAAPSSRHSFYRFIDTVITPSGLIWHVYIGPITQGES